MSHDKAIALMCFIGMLGIPALAMFCEKRAEIHPNTFELVEWHTFNKWWRIGAFVWIVFWLLPPLALIWIKGVLG